MAIRKPLPNAEHTKPDVTSNRNRQSMDKGITLQEEYNSQNQASEPFYCAIRVEGSRDLASLTAKRSRSEYITSTPLL